MKLRCSFEFKWVLLGFYVVALCLVTGSVLSAAQPEVSQAYDEEERILTAIQINPKHSMGYARLSLYYQQQKRWDDAVEALEKGLSVDPKSVPLLRMRGKLHQVLGNPNQALKFYDEVLENNPEPTLLLDRAQMLWSFHNVQPAIKDLKQALEQAPELFEVHLLLGLIYSTQKKGNEALNELIRAAQLEGQHSELWRQISLLWKERGDFPKARSAMYEAVKLNPNSYQYLQLYASMLEKTIYEEETQKELASVLKSMLHLFPEDAWTHGHYGNLEFYLKQEAQAEASLTQAVTIRKDYPWAWFRLGSLYTQQKRWDLAVSSFMKGLEYEPDNLQVKKQLVLVYEMQEDLPKAIPLYQLLLKKAPEAELFQRLSQLYWKALKFQEALETLKQGLRLFPENPELNWELGSYYEASMQLPKAKAAYLSILEKNPAHLQALVKLALLEKKLRHPKQSQSYFKQILQLAPQYHWAYIQLIRLQLQDPHFEEQAEQSLLQYLKGDPNSEWGYLQLGLLQLKQKRFQEAEATLKLGLDKYAQSSWLHESLALVYEAQGKWTEALAEFNSATVSRPDDPSLLSHQSFIYTQLQQPAQALEKITSSMLVTDWGLWEWYQFMLLHPQTYQETWLGKDLAWVKPILNDILSYRFQQAQAQIEVAPLEEIAREALKRFLSLAQSKGKVKPFAEQAFKTKPPLWVQFQEGFIQERQGNLASAIRHYLQVLQDVPEPSWIHIRLGVVYEKQDQLEQSIHHYSLFVQHYPHSLWGTFRIAVNMGLLGKEAEAIEKYKTILNVYSKHAASLNNLAWLYLTSPTQQKNVSSALKLAKLAVDLQDSDDHLDTLAEAYFQSGNQSQAIETIKRAILKSTLNSKKFKYLMQQYERFQQGELKSLPGPFEEST
ncbi:tetratricopeptide repeat protein [Deltaproteobacteria bacterium TL4]